LTCVFAGNFENFLFCRGEGQQQIPFGDYNKKGNSSNQQNAAATRNATATAAGFFFRLEGQVF
jgi:hypothetical protein